MPISWAEIYLDMYGQSEGGITHSYWLCVLGMAEKVREASARGDTVLLKRLLDDGVKPLPDEHGRSPLQIAAAAGHADICEILLRSGVDVNAADTTGMTPLQRAAAEGHLEIVKILLKHNADISHQDNIHGNSALHEASWRGFSHTVAALAKALGTQRGPLHTRNHAGFAPLHLACQNGHNQSCRELLLAGCNPDLQNNYGDTPLHTSARYGHAGVTRILISALCKVSDQNKNGDTALHIAAAMGRRKLTRILLEVSCNYALRNKQGETAKDIAKRKNLIEILDIFSKYRQKPSTSTSKPTKTTVPTTYKPFKTPPNPESTKKTKKSPKTGSKVHFSPSKPPKEWSPYGCHYYPDPEAFPQPKLDSLPSDPLARGEQYYLDLGGNIRKGPVGVGYTCYCAPFFRHMEAKLERDKAELKAHIDQAHERLDLKVAHLEKKTRNQINELTRCVAADKLDCQSRHEHLRRWLNRGGHGRHSERVLRQDRAGKRDEPARARSLEDLLDEKEEERSFEIPGETSAHRSLDNLDIPAIPRLSKSLKDLSSEEGRPKEGPKLNETFDGVIGRDRTSPLGAAASPTVSLRSCGIKGQQGFRMPEERDIAILEDDKEGWKISSSRRSVHEMIKRFQQGTTLHSSWRRTRSIGSGSNLSSEHSQCGAGHRVQPQGTSPNGWHEGQENESESSEGEEDGEDSKPLNGIGHKIQRGIPSGPHYDSIAKMPYRSRSAVYSPTPPLNDVHNDSGYSTRMYGSSKGASPSLSGQLECDVILPTARNHFPSGKQLSALLEQPRGHDLTVYERGADNVVINIGAASLV